uniref:Uncharacterized protein n=1 Tax=Arundo donax TaxID=35708 RepID=A0A0A9DE23_ARUDO
MRSQNGHLGTTEVLHQEVLHLCILGQDRELYPHQGVGYTNE